MQTPSLRRRVVLTGVAVTGLALLTASTAVYLVQEHALTGQLDETLDERGELVVQAAAAQRDLPDLARELRARGLRVILTSPDGVTHSTNPDAPRLGRNLPGPTGAGEPALHTRTFDLPDGTTADVAVSRAGVDLALRRLLLVELVTTAIALLAVAALLHRSARTALRPLDTLIETANAIASDGLTRRLNPDQPATELGAAAAAFDRMLDQLEESVATAVTAQRTTRNLLDTVAHQLRTPITGATTAIQTHRHLHPDPPDHHLLDIVDRETRRAGHLVGCLLRLAQLDHGFPLHPRPVDLHHLIQREVDRATQGAPHLRVDMCDTGSVIAHVDPDATAEILANVLDNATRYAATRIDVTITTSLIGVAVQIADDGPGVPPEHHQAIFERFTTLDDRSGTGLGLAIARELAHAQRGELTYDGAFTLVLPGH